MADANFCWHTLWMVVLSKPYGSWDFFHPQSHLGDLREKKHVFRCAGRGPKRGDAFTLQKGFCCQAILLGEFLLKILTLLSANLDLEDVGKPSGEIEHSYGK